MSHPLDTDALYACECGEWHYKWEVGPYLPCRPERISDVRESVSENNQKQFKVEYKNLRGDWSKQYVWTTSAEKALKIAKAVLGEDCALEWKEAEEA